MPGKSRHSRGKHPHHSKKSKAIRRQVSTPVQSPADKTPGPVAPARVEPAPRTAAPAEAAAAMPRYTYVVQELKRIGIIAGIIIVALIVLSVVLS